MNRTGELPIERKSYINVSLITGKDGAGNAWARFIRTPKGGKPEIIKEVAGSSSGTWSDDVDTQNYDYFIYTKAYAGWPWGHGKAEATVKSYPYYKLSILNNEPYGRGEVKVYDVSQGQLLGSSFSNFRCERIANNKLRLEDYTNDGYVF